MTCIWLRTHQSTLRTYGISIDSVFRPSGATVKWTDSLTLLHSLRNIRTNICDKKTFASKGWTNYKEMTTKCQEAFRTRQGVCEVLCRGSWTLEWNRTYRECSRACVRVCSIVRYYIVVERYSWELKSHKKPPFLLLFRSVVVSRTLSIMLARLLCVSFGLATGGVVLSFVQTALLFSLSRSSWHSPSMPPRTQQQAEPSPLHGRRRRPIHPTLPSSSSIPLSTIRLPLRTTC